MADNSLASETTAAPISPTAYRGRGRGHARQLSDSQNSSDGRGRGTHRGPRGPGRGGRGRGRGRGQGRDNLNNFSPTVSAPAPLSGEAGTAQSNARPPGGSFGARLTETASKNQGDPQIQEGAVQGQDETAVAEDVEVCFICASPIDHIAIAPCNHQTCHICALRLRALYKTRACAHCRTEGPFVVFTDDAEKHYSDFDNNDFVKIDEGLGIKYEKDVILEDTILLLRYNCPDKECDVACLGWPDLHRHVKSKHGKIMCDLCTRNKKVFTHEHELFTFGELRRHEKFGDDNPGAVDQSGFKGHPECGFCRQRFYGDDELYTHCREKHERCHICDRRNGGRHPQYYLNYQELEKHFADAHFVCMDAECQANKTNVFESEMDLKAHQLSEHPNGLTKDARRDARLVSLSGFDLRTPYQPQRGNERDRDRGRDREHRGAGRGRDPNAEPLPMSSAQSLSRAELAFQRQMAVQSSQNIAPRNFGGSLTQSAAPASRPQASSTNQSAHPGPPSLDTLSISSPAQNFTAATPQDQARQLRHQAVTERATNLLSNNQAKLSQFRTHVSSYRSNTISANELIDDFFALFDCPSTELGKLIRELADLYEDEPKRQQLLEAWNNWRSINEDYPVLPAPAGNLPTSNTVVNLSHGRRVLKLKSSTQQSSRSTMSRHGSWGNALNPNLLGVPGAGGGSSRPGSGTSTPRHEAFPALATSSSNRRAGQSSIWNIPASSTTSNPTSTKITTTTAANSNAKSSSTASRLQNITSRAPPPTMSSRQNEDLFPSLPAAPKPNVMIAGINTKGHAKWGNNRVGVSNGGGGGGGGGSGSASPWANGSLTPTPAQAAAATAGLGAKGGVVGGQYGSGGGGGGEEDGGVAGKKKGKKGKGKGETLFHFG